MDNEKPAAIRLSGDNILEEHCYFENNDGKVVIQSLPDSVTVSSTPRDVEELLLTPLAVFKWQTNCAWPGESFSEDARLKTTSYHSFSLINFVLGFV